MALFKILRGKSSNFTTDLTAAAVNPPFKDGYCYFIPDTGLFYIDYEDAESNEKHRIPLNAGDALSLAGATLEQVLTDNELHIPSSALLTKVLKDKADVVHEHDMTDIINLEAVLNNFVTTGEALTYVELTQAEYDALTEKDGATLYLIIS